MRMVGPILFSMATDAIETTLSAMKAAQKAHADLLKWDNVKRGFVPLCDDATLRASFIASLEAEREFYLACGDTESAEQIGYRIEDESR